jgi:hypothetical protein
MKRMLMLSLLALAAVATAQPAIAAASSKANIAEDRLSVLTPARCPVPPFCPLGSGVTL